MVMPRSRSRSMASRTWASISRAWSAPVTSRMRSARVDLPWSMWAMIEKLRMWLAMGERPVWRVRVLRLFDAEVRHRPATVDVALEEDELAVVDADDVGGPGLEGHLAGVHLHGEIA